MAQPNQPLPRAHFRPRPLENLALADEIESLNPILDSKVLNLLPNSDTPQIFTLNGRGSRSVLRTLRHGLEVEETVSSDLPGIPNAVWTVKTRSDGESHATVTMGMQPYFFITEVYDSYIILSFVNGTLVLSIGENIEEVQDTGFLSSAPTLAVQQIGDDALLQVHPLGIRHVLVDRRVNEWRVPSGKTIVAATTNKRQVVVALSSAELVYFELDLDGQLNEYQDRKAMGSTVLAMSIGEVPEGRQRTPYLVSTSSGSRHELTLRPIGRGLRGPDRPHHFFGPRQHARDDQFASADLTPFLDMHCGYARCRNQPESTDSVCQHWTSDWRSSKNCLGSCERSTH